MIKAFFSLIDFVKELFNFTKWFSERKDVREEKANKTKAVKTHDKNSADIDATYK